MREDLFSMERAVALGKISLRFAGINPAVGAVVVRNGAIAGEGYHRGPGTAHAEVAAISAALGGVEKIPPRSLAGATLYSTLEPCCHAGGGKRTPPCTEAIIASGIGRVVIGCLDPNPLVCGKGVERLREAGIQVDVGLLATEAAELIKAFAVSVRERRPFIRLKWAQSLDGRIACRGGASRWITNEEARRRSRELRLEHDAVLIGAGTLRTDDPRLTVRDASAGAEGREPLRVVLAGREPLSPTARLFSAPFRAGTLVLAAEGSPAIESCKREGIPAREVEADGAGLPEPAAAFRSLYAEGIGSVLVEGGATVETLLLRKGLWDAVTVFVAPLLIGAGIEAVGELGVRDPSLGVKLEGARFEPGCGYLRVDAERDPAGAAAEERSCLRA